MKNFYIIFSGIYLVIFLSSHFHAKGQWTSTNGPTGGLVNDIFEFNGTLYCGRIDGGLYEHNGEGWISIPGTEDLTVYSITHHDDSIIAGVNNGILIFGPDKTIEYRETPSPFVYSVSSAGQSIYAGTVYGVYRSDDNGQSWIDINNELTRVGIETTYANDSVVFIGTNKTGTGGADLFRSRDMGNNWTSVGAVLNLDEPVSSILMYDDEVYFTSSDVYRSANLGDSWETISNNLNDNKYDDLAIRDDTVYLLNKSRGYLYISSDFGGNWTEENLTTTGFLYPLSIRVSAGSILIGSEGFGIQKRDRDSEEWIDYSEGLLLSWNTDYISRADTLFVSTESSKIYYAVDLAAADPWSRIKNSNQTIRVLGRQNGYLFAAGNPDKIYRSKEPLENWEYISISHDPAEILEIKEFGSNANHLFAATTLGLYRTADSGDSWEKLNVQANGISVSRVHHVTIRDSVVLAGTASGAFLSTDEGNTWKYITDNFSDSTVYSSVIHDSLILVGTTEGIFRSPDFGNTWQQVVSSTCYTMISCNRTVIAGSYSADDLILSNDLGLTWRTINEGLSGSLDFIGFSRKYVLAGSKGVWKRPVYELMPPEVKFITGESGNVFIGGHPVYIQFDQKIRNVDGSLITAADLQDLITVAEAADLNSNLSFDAVISDDHMTITLIPENVQDSVEYIITLQPVANLGELTTEEIHSQELLAVINSCPVLTGFALSTEAGMSLKIPFTEFKNSYQDPDDNPVQALRIDTLPGSGTLYWNGLEVTAGMEIIYSSNDSLEYTPVNNYIGPDRFYWNAFDGFLWSDNPGTVDVEITYVTSLAGEIPLSGSINIYPNPVKDVFTMKIKNAHHPLSSRLVDRQGRLIKTIQITEEDGEFSLENLPPGLYYLVIRSYNKLAGTVRIIKE